MRSTPARFGASRAQLVAILAAGAPRRTISEIQNRHPARRLPMLKMARYAAIPHANARTHKIPIGVIEHLTGKREQDALDGKRCLFEALVISHGDLPTTMRPVVVVPSSGGEV